MALSQMMSGGDKGSNNPLSKLASSFQQDRGAQRDIYDNARAGPSRQTPSFRTSQPSSLSQQQRPNQQYQQQPKSTFDVSSLAQALQQPSSSSPATTSAGWASSFLQQQGQQLGRSMDQRQRDEMNRVYQSVRRGGAEGGVDWRNDFLHFERDNAAVLMLPPDHVAALDRAFDQAARAPTWALPSLSPPHKIPRDHHYQQQQPVYQPQPSSFSREHNAPQPTNLTSSSLSETASLLLSSVDQQTSSSPEQAAKFQNSAFMGLMRQFQDGSADVKGDELVQQQQQQQPQTSTLRGEGWEEAFRSHEHIRTAGGTMGKGKGRAEDWTNEFDASSQQQQQHSSSSAAYSDTYSHLQSSGFHQYEPSQLIPRLPLRNQQFQPINQTSAKDISSWDAQFEAVSSSLNKPRPSSVHFADEGLSHERLEHDTHIPGSFSAWEETLDFGLEGADEEEMQDEDAFAYYNGSSRMRTGKDDGTRVMQGEAEASERMMDEWEEVGGNRTEDGEGKYTFQEGNPWVDERWARGKEGEEGDAFQSVLEQEARVLRDPGNAKEWYDLGVKQQEHERESLAILALEKAISIDPSNPSPYLALAVSHTNNNDRLATFSTLESWIMRSAETNPSYASALEEAKGKREMGMAAEGKERFDWIVSVLVGMARSETEVDADVQIALGVLFNTSGEFALAQDCFRTALQVRPDDWQLYNRLGATLANGGRAEEAHDFYWQALELRPSFVRARFNLGISCINLKRYEEAASHILTALRLQHTDSTFDERSSKSSKGIGSDALWETLKNACTYMHRTDLVKLAEQRDLDAFENVEETFSGNATPVDLNAGGGMEDWTPPPGRSAMEHP